MGAYQRLTEQDRQFMRDNWQAMTCAEIADQLGRTKATVASLASAMGLKKTPEAKSESLRKGWLTNTNRWTDDELAYLRLHFPTQSRTQLAAGLGKTHGAVKRMCYHLRLLKESEQVRLIQARPNAGQFKKGQQPPNTIASSDKPIIRVRKDKRGVAYQFIRLAIANWIPLHTHIWQQENGTMPDGHAVIFINGDTMDVRLDNLRLVTRKELRLLNSPINRLTDRYVANTIAWRDENLKPELLKHPELIDLKRNQLLLNRAINHGKSN